MLSVLKELWWFRATIIMVATPVLLLAILPCYEQLGLTQKACNCLYMLLLMAVYWCTETVNLAVTSLIPLALSPLLSIQKADLVARNYFKDLNILFMGGLLIAVLIEYSQLHRRIALSILRKFGTNPRFLMLGFMIPTWLLSMWVSNSATAAMMLTIVQAVITQLKEMSADAEENQPSGSQDINSADSEAADVETADIETADIGAADIETGSSDTEMTESVKSANDDASSKWDKIAKALCLSVAYAASCGGIATLTGTAPNLIMTENVNRIGMNDLGGYDFNVDFVTWMAFGFPVSAIMLILTWIWLQILFIGFRCNTQTSEESLQIQTVINKAYSELGHMTFSEVMAAIHFALLGLLWVSRNPGGAGGWESLFQEGYVSDGTAAMFVAILMFMWPSELPDVCCLRGHDGPPKKRKPLITWDIVSRKCHWGLILLMGGGFALADSIEVSGLSSSIGKSLNIFTGLPIWMVAICLSAITACVTEITSNTAISSIFLPIVGKSAVELHLHPLYLMLPVTISASFAFMLPVATGPNALAFSSGYLTVSDMAKAGAMLNLLGVGVSTMASLTWGVAIFNLNESPFNLTEVARNMTFDYAFNSTDV